MLCIFYFILITLSIDSTFLQKLVRFTDFPVRVRKIIPLLIFCFCAYRSSFFFNLFTINTEHIDIFYRSKNTQKKVQPCVTRVTPNVRLFLHKFSDQIVFCGTCDLYFYKIAGHQHLAGVDKDITVNIRGIGIGSCDICRFVCYFSLNHGI